MFCLQTGRVASDISVRNIIIYIHVYIYIRELMDFLKSFVRTPCALVNILCTRYILLTGCTFKSHIFWEFFIS